MEPTIATGKPQSVLAEIETAHFHGRKGTRVAHMLNAGNVYISNCSSNQLSVWHGIKWLPN